MKGSPQCSPGRMPRQSSQNHNYINLHKQSSNSSEVSCNSYNEDDNEDIDSTNSQPCYSRKSSQETYRRLSTRPLSIASTAFNTLTPVVDNEKRQVYMAVDMDVTNINVVNQSFNVVGWLNFWWIDVNLPNYQDDINTLDWQIQDDGKNLPMDPAVKLFDNGNHLILLSQPKFDYNYESNCVAWRLNFSVDISESFELERFPFDRQFLTILLNIRTTFWHVLHQAPSWVPDRYNSHRLCFYRLAAGCTGWTPFSPLVDLDHVFPSKPRVTLRIERNSNYYLYSLIFPLFLIVLSAASSCYVEDLGDRLQVTLTLMLTIVAFKYAIADDIPKTTYLTLIDTYIMACYIILVLVCVENVIATNFVGDELQRMVDIIFSLIFLAFWTILHICVGLGAHFGWFRIPWIRMEEEQKQLFFTQQFVEKRHIKPATIKSKSFPKIEVKHDKTNNKEADSPDEKKTLPLFLKTISGTKPIANVISTSLTDVNEPINNTILISPKKNKVKVYPMQSEDTVNKPHKDTNPNPSNGDHLPIINNMIEKVSILHNKIEKNEVHQ